MRSIKNVRFPFPKKERIEKNSWCISIDEKDIIREIHSCSKPNSIKDEDWNFDWLSPRGFDLQINGGLGLDFSRLIKDDIPSLLYLLDFLWTQGVEAVCPTIVTCNKKSLRNSLEIFRIARELHSENRCRLLGAHLEGPFISKKYSGAHSLDEICAPSLEDLRQRISGYEEDISIFTLAPELEGAFEVINEINKLGIIASLGHSAADYDMSLLAFDRGVKMITHAFNAMPGIHHRSPGPVVSAISRGNISIGLIADGVHVDKHMIDLIYRLSGDNLFLVSDAISPYGLPEGKYKWDSRDIIAKNGVCRLLDGTLAGVTLPLMESIKRMSLWTGDESSAIWSGTVAPRSILGENMDLTTFYIGKSLRKLLRWSSKSNKLTWSPAQ
tara:strand:+ start:94 stop:1245 length:1152 start_codon:yes stop_codon:yes gene_type:complete